MNDKIQHQPHYESFTEAHAILVTRFSVVLEAYEQLRRAPVDSLDPRHAAHLANVTRYEPGYQPAPQVLIAQPEQRIVTPDKTQPLVTHQAPEATFEFTPDMDAMQAEAAAQVDELRFTPEMVAMQEEARRIIRDTHDAQENTPAYN